MLSLFRALSALLVLVVIALVAALITMRLAIHKTEVHVPALIGMPVPEAVIHLHQKGLKAGLDGHFYSRTEPSGRVLTQSPPAGTDVRKSWRVRLAVSLGPQKVAIPRVDGMDQTLAAMTIQRTGLKIGDVVSIPYPYVPENTVVAQTPGPNAKDVESPEIDLLVAQASSPQRQAQGQASVMPDLNGENFTTAALAVIHAGFTLAPVETPAVSPASPPASSANTMAHTTPAAIGPPAPPSGTVIAQNPAPGSRILAGATIQLTVQP